MRKALPYILSLSLLVYLIIVFTFVARNRKEVICRGLHIEFEDSEGLAFIEEADVERLIRNGYGELLEQPVNNIDKDRIEQILINDSVIKSAQVYTGLDGTFHIDVEQRRPILRVMAGRGYYIDEEGEFMPLSDKYTARVIVASGKISRKFAKEELYPYVLYLKNDKLWDPYIEQIIVRSETDIRLVPKVGNFEIVLGDLRNVSEKMERLRCFLIEGIEKKGWNTYKEINLKFDKQVVCIKK